MNCVHLKFLNHFMCNKFKCFNTDDNVILLLPLAEEYQMEKITARCEEHLLNGASTIKNYLIAQQYNLKKTLRIQPVLFKTSPS